jgi:hypothetical protein
MRVSAPRSESPAGDSSLRFAAVTSAMVSASSRRSFFRKAHAT